MSANVLLVDDSPVIRRMTREQLERLGVEVREAGDAQGALRALQQRVPDLVCVDLMLPEVSGYELCERIRADPTVAMDLIFGTTWNAAHSALKLVYWAAPLLLLIAIVLFARRTKPVKTIRR